MPGFRKLIVVEAYDVGADGDLVLACDPRQMQSEEAAIYQAQMLINQHAGILAWSRHADTVHGETEPPVILFQHGRIPEF